MKQKCINTLALLGLGLLALNGQAQVKPISSVTTPTSTFVLNATLLSKGDNTFSNNFNNTATGRNDVNAYLLCYLTTLIYPQYLCIVANNPASTYVDRLHTDPDFFQAEYAKYTSSLFGAPQFQFVHESQGIGYDPEAMVISTAASIFVIFRGTDRVGTAKVGSLQYDWGEWLASDFDARYASPPEITGKVLNGMWQSLECKNFKDELVEAIRSKGGANKKIWIAGHSLGSGQAQLFAMYLSKKGLTPQGVYLYAAPHPGTQEFVDELNRILPGGRLQRFDFVSDPITTLAPYLLGYRRAGTRVYYNDIKTIQFGAPERPATDGLALFPSLLGAGANTIADIVNGKINSTFKLDVFTPGGSPMCYHHPLWYLRAAYNQLSAAEKDKVPVALPTPDPNLEGCDLGTVARGNSSNPLVNIGTISTSLIDGGAALVKAGIDQLTFTANTIISNVTGSAIDEGNYYIRSYPAEQDLGLNEQNGLANGSALKLTTEKSKVKVERFGAVGYIISFGTKQVQGFLGPENKTYVLDSKAEDLFDDGQSSIQLWEKNNVPGFSSNQRWLFIKVRDNKYVIKNLANGKLLDANNACINDNACGVKTWPAISNDQTQIWIMEKAN